MKINLMAIFCLVCHFSYGQDKKVNTLVLSEGQESPPAKIEQVAWMAGYWKGEGLGGVAEELWLPPSGGNMACVFRMVKDGKVDFFEICAISEEGNTLILKLKHFNSELLGWEEKDETVNFRLVKIEKNKVYFDGLTFEKTADDKMNAYVIAGKKDGKVSEFKFSYTKVSF